MATKTTFINSTVAEYTDKEFSWLQDIVLQAGYFADQDGTPRLQVTEKSPASMGVKVGLGKMLSTYTKSATTWKVIVELTADEPLTIASNSSGINRVDAIIVKLQTTTEPNTLKSNVATVEVVQGSGATALTDGAITTAIGAGYVFTRLANVTVANGATSIVNANIANVLEKVKVTKAVSVDADAIVFGSTGSFTPVVRRYQTTGKVGDNTSSFNISNPIATNTMRVTWNGSGTDPVINATTFPVGTVVDIQADAFSSVNRGLFTVINSGANFFDVTNPSLIVESNKTVSYGQIVRGYIWTKPPNLSHIKVRGVGSGAGGSSAYSNGSGSNAGAGGNSGAYGEKLIIASALPSSVFVSVGDGGAGGPATGTSPQRAMNGMRTLFGSIIFEGGLASTDTINGNPTLASCTGVDVSVGGSRGGSILTPSNSYYISGIGGGTPFGNGGLAQAGNSDGHRPVAYGAGASGAARSSTGNQTGGTGQAGVLIVEEYYNN